MLTGYVAFLDVLGFSSLVSGDRHADRIAAYLNSLCTISDPAAKTTPANAIEYVVFSDSIIITTKDDSDESFELLLARCSLVFGALLQNEISVRGAIAHGTFMREKTPSGTFVAGEELLLKHTSSKKNKIGSVLWSPHRSVREFRTWSVAACSLHRVHTIMFKNSSSKSVGRSTCSVHQFRSTEKLGKQSITKALLSFRAPGTLIQSP
jgi:hypothetical protein